MVEFFEDGAMKPKVYPFDFAIRGENHWQIIIITYDECTFSANDRIRKAWTWEKDTFLQPKGREQGIIVWKFIFLFARLNLASLPSEKSQEVIEKTGLMYSKSVEKFHYGKNNDRYWDKPKQY